MTPSSTNTSPLAIYAAMLYAERAQSFRELTAELAEVLYTPDGIPLGLGRAADNICHPQVQRLERAIETIGAGLPALGDATRFFNASSHSIRTGAPRRASASRSRKSSRRTTEARSIS